MTKAGVFPASWDHECARLIVDWQKLQLVFRTNSWKKLLSLGELVNGAALLLLLYLERVNIASFFQGVAPSRSISTNIMGSKTDKQCKFNCLLTRLWDHEIKTTTKNEKYRKEDGAYGSIIG